MEDLALPIFILLLCGCGTAEKYYLATDWQHMNEYSAKPSLMGSTWDLTNDAEFANFVRCGTRSECI